MNCLYKNSCDGFLVYADYDIYDVLILSAFLYHMTGKVVNICMFYPRAFYTLTIIFAIKFLFCIILISLIISGKIQVSQS